MGSSSTLTRLKIGGRATNLEEDWLAPFTCRLAKYIRRSPKQSLRSEGEEVLEVGRLKSPSWHD